MDSADKDQACGPRPVVDGLHSAAQHLFSAAGEAYAHGEDNDASYLRDLARSLLKQARDFCEDEHLS